MARTDYKFWFIRRDDDGFIEEAAIRFYEGDYVLEGGKQVYKRTKRLAPQDLKHLNKSFIGEANGNPATLYTYQDFGRIKTDDELRSFLNKEIGKDKARTPIDEQKGV